MVYLKEKNFLWSGKKVVSGFFITIAFLMSLVTAQTTLADTDDPTPANGSHYQYNEASYYDKSTSSYYHGVWTDAKDAWNNTGAFTWNEDIDPNCLTFTSSVSENTGAWADATGMTWNNVTVDNMGNQTGAKIYLNRYNLKKYGYSKQERTYVAEHELGHAMGLGHNEEGSESVMNPANRDYPIETCDIDGVNAIYNSQSSLSSSSTVDIEYAKDYSGKNGVDTLKNDAQDILMGTITNSVPHTSDSEDGNTYTTQTLKISKSLKGNITGQIDFNQAGSDSIKVENSQLLERGDSVIVMLNKDDAGNYYVIDDGQGIFLSQLSNNQVNNNLNDLKTDGGPSGFIRVSDQSSYTENTLQ